MRQSSTRSAGLILWVLLLVLAFLIVCPLVSVFAEAVILDGRLDLYRAWTIIADPENLQTIGNSLLLGVCVVLLSTVIAAPTAYLLARSQLGKQEGAKFPILSRPDRRERRLEHPVKENQQESCSNKPQI